MKWNLYPYITYLWAFYNIIFETRLFYGGKKYTTDNRVDLANNREMGKLKPEYIVYI